MRKLYYSISEVSKLTGLEQYTLRYWESEFPQLRPAKNRAGNRIYTHKDIELILKIKELLKNKRYTFEGARKILEDEKLELQPKRKKRKKLIAQSLLESDENDELKTTAKPKQKQIYTETERDLKEDLLAMKEFLLFLKSKFL